jgi:hypothetical protein
MEAAAEEKQRLTVQTLQLDPWPTQRDLSRAPDHPQKREVGQCRQTGLFPDEKEPRLDQRREGLHQNAQAAVEGGTQDDDITQAEDQPYAQIPQPGL